MSETTSLEAWPLHERARLAGAPPHWLGHLDVDDVHESVSQLVAMGAEPLGPTVNTEGGLSWATLRDPFGSVVALRSRGAVPPTNRPVAWHQLHTRDLERAWPTYAKLAGWHDVGTINVNNPEGGHRLFAWSPGGEAVGSVANTARWPGVHTHWLFSFPVEDIEVAIHRVRDHGGTAPNPVELPNGARVTACDDPQGAAFGLIQPRLS